MTEKINGLDLLSYSPWNYFALRRHAQWVQARGSSYVYLRLTWHGFALVVSNVPLTLRQLYSV